MIYFGLRLDVASIEDDESTMIDSFYFQKLQVLPLPPIDWSILELKKLDERTTCVMRSTRD